MKSEGTTAEMTVAEIIQQLTPYTGRFPKQAVQAAIAKREAITPHLLKALEDVAQAPEEYAKRSDYMLHTFALYLLAQFREKRAYPLAIKLLMSPGELPDELLGDTITQGLSNILGSIYDGDPAPLQRLVEGDEVNEWVRGSALGTFLVLVHTGQLSREKACQYFRTLFEGGLKREHQQVWNELACAVGDLPAPELVELLRQAYDEDLIAPGYADFEGVARDAQGVSERQLTRLREVYRLTKDTVAEMEWWAAFKAADWPKKPKLIVPDALPRVNATADSPGEPGTPARRGPKVGRNDPCPCGSGLKYKKCCLDKK